MSLSSHPLAIQLGFTIILNLSTFFVISTESCFAKRIKSVKLSQYLLSLLLLICIQFSFAKKKNIVFEFEPQIEQLISLSDSLFYSNTIMGKINANNEFRQVLRSILKDSTSIQYDFSRVKCLSVLNDPRGKAGVVF